MAPIVSPHDFIWVRLSARPVKPSRRGSPGPTSCAISSGSSRPQTTAMCRTSGPAALAEIPSTFGIPNPPNDTSMNLGVAAVQRFLAAFPAHPRAVRAAYEIGASYLARGKSDLALAAFSRFLKDDGFKVETDQARRDQAELAMTATFQYAQILQGQQKFHEAIAAWKGYLANFPNGPQSADAQRAILDTQLLAAAEHLSRGRYVEARTAWSEFVAQNPLDRPRAVDPFPDRREFPAREEIRRGDRRVGAADPASSPPANPPATPSS